MSAARIKTVRSWVAILVAAAAASALLVFAWGDMLTSVHGLGNNPFAITRHS
jgi:hypothetical protein